MRLRYGRDFLPFRGLVAGYAEVFDLGRLLRIGRCGRLILSRRARRTLRHFAQQFARALFRAQPDLGGPILELGRWRARILLSKVTAQVGGVPLMGAAEGGTTSASLARSSHFR